MHSLRRHSTLRAQSTRGLAAPYEEWSARARLRCNAPGPTQGASRTGRIKDRSEAADTHPHTLGIDRTCDWLGASIAPVLLELYCSGNLGVKSTPPLGDRQSICGYHLEYDPP